jgi:hypothetical protein
MEKEQAERSCVGSIEQNVANEDRVALTDRLRGLFLKRAFWAE